MMTLREEEAQALVSAGPVSREKLVSAGQTTRGDAGTSQGETAADLDEGRTRGSRLLWAVDRFTGRAPTAFGVLAAGLAWVVLSAAFGFPAGWETVFQTLVAAVTVVMVFVIQHTQARHQAATQRKLDEILRALPEADNSLLALEHASDDELRATRLQHRQIRRAALADDRPRPGQRR
jgi:low affinity Fe/Cu permease